MDTQLNLFSWHKQALQSRIWLRLSSHWLCQVRWLSVAGTQESKSTRTFPSNQWNKKFLADLRTTATDRTSQQAKSSFLEVQELLCKLSGTDPRQKLQTKLIWLSSSVPHNVHRLQAMEPILALKIGQQLQVIMCLLLPEVKSLTPVDLALPGCLSVLNSTKLINKH